MYKIEELVLWEDEPEKVVYRYFAPGEIWTFLKVRKGHSVVKPYEKGIVKSKTPEVNVLLSGLALYVFKDTETEETVEETVVAPSMIRIKPNVYHEVHALEELLLIKPYEKEHLDENRFKSKEENILKK
jgi:hypothetical protein